MSRIRTIKPEFFDDEKLARVSRDARLLFLGLWTRSDDFGVVRGNLRWLRSQIFPYDEDVTAEIFKIWVDQLVDQRLIVGFDAKNEAYFYIYNFTKHQKIDRPSKTLRNPEPPIKIVEGSEKIVEGSLKNARGREGKGREGIRKGREGSGSEGSPLGREKIKPKTRRKQSPASSII